MYHTHILPSSPFIHACINCILITSIYTDFSSSAPPRREPCIQLHVFYYSRLRRATYAASWSNVICVPLSSHSCSLSLGARPKHSDARQRVEQLIVFQREPGISGQNGEYYAILQHAHKFFWHYRHCHARVKRRGLDARTAGASVAIYTETSDYRDRTYHSLDAPPKIFTEVFEGYMKQHWHRPAARVAWRS